MLFAQISPVALRLNSNCFIIHEHSDLHLSGSLSPLSSTWAPCLLTLTPESPLSQKARPDMVLILNISLLLSISGFHCLLSHPVNSCFICLPQFCSCSLKKGKSSNSKSVMVRSPLNLYIINFFCNTETKKFILLHVEIIYFGVASFFSTSL